MLAIDDASFSVLFETLRYRIIMIAAMTATMIMITSGFLIMCRSMANLVPFGSNSGHFSESGRRASGSMGKQEFVPFFAGDPCFLPRFELAIGAAAIDGQDGQRVAAAFRRASAASHRRLMA